MARAVTGRARWGTGFLLAGALSVTGLAAGSALAMDASDFPLGVLTIDGAGTIWGELGSSCFGGGCSDTPWLTPKSGPHARADVQMSFQLSGDWTITSWTASYGDASELQPDEQFLDNAENVTVSKFSFTGPPAGDWVLSVFVQFNAQGTKGDAVYYFRIHAGMPETDLAAPSPAPVPDQTPSLALAIAAAVGALAGWPLRRRAFSGA